MKAVEWYVSVLRVVAISRGPLVVSLVLRVVSAIRWGYMVFGVSMSARVVVSSLALLLSRIIRIVVAMTVEGKGVIPALLSVRHTR
jgi:hypothetical protein